MHLHIESPEAVMPRGFRDVPSKNNTLSTSREARVSFQDKVSTSQPKRGARLYDVITPNILSARVLATAWRGRSPKLAMQPLL
jgi:hypothetical protein